MREAVPTQPETDSWYPEQEEWPESQASSAGRLLLVFPPAEAVTVYLSSLLESMVCLRKTIESETSIFRRLFVEGAECNQTA